jgi:glucosylceramidase
VGGNTSSGGSKSTGGKSGTGGSGTVSTGGKSSTGGSGTVSTGGKSSTGGSGTVSTGGNSSTGGTNAITGGTSNAGGAATGGASSTGGSVPTGPIAVTSAQNAFWKTATVTTGASGTADVTVNTTTAQTFDGFGGTFNEMGWNVLSMLSAADKDKALQLLFGTDGARFAFGRVPIGASDYAMSRYTHNETANDYSMTSFSIDRDKEKLIPYIQAALAIKPDIRLWASPWTPPSWMKSPPYTTTTGTSSAFDGGTMKDDAQVLTAHALYLAKFVEEYAKLNIKIEAIHPQNEPGYDTRYPSCLWSAALFNKFIRDYLGPTFDTRGVAADIYVGTMSNADSGKDGTILSTITGDSNTMKYVKGFGLQWNMLPNVEGLKSRNLPIVQTEHKCGNYPWNPAGFPAFNSTTPPNDYAYGVESWGYIRDWIKAGVSQYAAWNMVLDTNGQNIDSQRPWPQNALLTVNTSTKALTITPAYYVFRHVSQYVEPGAKVLGTSSNEALAFKNTDGSTVVVMYNSGAAKTAIVSVGTAKLSFSMPSNGWATIKSN